MTWSFLQPGSRLFGEIASAAQTRGNGGVLQTADTHLPASSNRSPIEGCEALTGLKPTGCDWLHAQEAARVESICDACQHLSIMFLPTSLECHHRLSKAEDTWRLLVHVSGNSHMV